MSIDPGLIDMIMRLRSRGISSNAVLRAIELAPRRFFVPLEKRPMAYDAASVPIACGQTLPSPMTAALMVQMLDVQPNHKVLTPGLGSGYLAAILSHMATRIYTVERYKTLIQDASERFRALDIYNVVTRHGDGRYGWPGQAPFDRIVMGYALRAEPEEILEQLAPGGKMLAVIDGMLTLFEKPRTKVSATELMPLDLDMAEAGKSRTL
jgi:protein-L-isoaspartate(D-aspartate) O-methyltransferase